jgi:PIN domain nuclease of toxin-antitoxin system
MAPSRQAEAVLDASALLAWLVQERGADVVGGYLPTATAISARDRGHLLSLADRCCLATAIRVGLPAVTGDRAWTTLDLDVEVVPFR